MSRSKDLLGKISFTFFTINLNYLLLNSNKIYRPNIVSADDRVSLMIHKICSYSQCGPQTVFLLPWFSCPKFGHPWPKGSEKSKRNFSEDGQCFGRGSKRAHSEYELVDNSACGTRKALCASCTDCSEISYTT